MCTLVKGVTTIHRIVVYIHGQGGYGTCSNLTYKAYGVGMSTEHVMTNYMVLCNEGIWCSNKGVVFSGGCPVI